MTLTRREMLKIGAGAAALLAAGPAALAAEEKKIKIGLQLYSLRDSIGRDVPGTLKALGKMGYAGVEFAGYYGRKAPELRKMLDDAGLVCCGTHTGIDTLQGDALKRTVEFNKALGNKYLIVPGLPGRFLNSVEAVKKTARLFDELAAKVKPEGMLVGYHAHAGDFRKLGDTTAWDLLFSSTGADVVMQLDTGNCLDGGADPYAILKKFPGRAKTIHMKEHGGKGNAPVGEGKVRWKEVIELCRAGGTEWYIIEQEAYDRPPLKSVEACLENLRKVV